MKPGMKRVASMAQLHAVVNGTHFMVVSGYYLLLMIGGAHVTGQSRDQ